MQKNARKDAGYFFHAPITIWFYLLLPAFYLLRLTDNQKIFLLFHTRHYLGYAKDKGKDPS